MDWCIKRGEVWWNPCLHPAPCSSKRDPKGSSISSWMTEGGRLWGRVRIAPDFWGLLESPEPIEITGNTSTPPERLLDCNHCSGGEVVIEQNLWLVLAFLSAGCSKLIDEWVDVMIVTTCVIHVDEQESPFLDYLGTYMIYYLDSHTYKTRKNPSCCLFPLSSWFQNWGMSSLIV